MRLDMLLALARPTQSLERARAARGSTFERVTPLGAELVVSSPDDAFEVLSDASAFLGGAANQAIVRIVGSRSTASLDGADHLARRRTSSVLFTSERASLRAGELYERATRALSSCSGGPPFRLQTLFRRLFVDWLADVVLGRTFSEAGRALVVERLLRLGDLAGLPLSALATSPRLEGALAALERLLRPLDVRGPILRELPRARGEGRVDEASLVGAFVARGLDDASIADEVVTYLGAGYDTTASAAAFALDLLLRHGSIRARLAAELEADPMGASSPLLGAVVREALRLRPILPVVSRVLVADRRVAGRPLAAGARVAVALYLLHRDPELVSDAESFCPDRFLAAGDLGRAYAPFGGGARRCPGRFFATRGIEVVVAAAMTRSIELCDRASPPAARGSTITPRGGVRVRVR